MQIVSEFLKLKSVNNKNLLRAKSEKKVINFSKKHNILILIEIIIEDL